MIDLKKTMLLMAVAILIYQSHAWAMDDDNDDSDNNIKQTFSDPLPEAAEDLAKQKKVSKSQAAAEEAQRKAEVERLKRIELEAQLAALQSQGSGTNNASKPQPAGKKLGKLGKK